MIYIKIDGHKILADDNGIPVDPPQYWLDDPNQAILKGIAEAYARGDYEVVSPPVLQPSLPNFAELRDEISYGEKYPLIQDWYDGLPPRQRDPLQDAISKQDLYSITTALLPILPTEDKVLKELETLLVEFNIPINLS